MKSPKSERIAPSIRFVRNLEGTYYLLREAAQLLDVSHRTLRNFVTNPSTSKQLGPSFYCYMGKIKIYLYTEQDIERIRKHLADQKAVYPAGEVSKPPRINGRPTKWTEEQRKERQRKFSQVHYYKNQAEKHANNGDDHKRDEAVRRMRQIQKELKEQKPDE